MLESSKPSDNPGLQSSPRIVKLVETRLPTFTSLLHRLLMAAQLLLPLIRRYRYCLLAILLFGGFLKVGNWWDQRNRDPLQDLPLALWRNYGISIQTSSYRPVVPLFNLSRELQFSPLEPDYRQHVTLNFRNTPRLSAETIAQLHHFPVVHAVDCQGSDNPSEFLKLFRGCPSTWLVQNLNLNDTKVTDEELLKYLDLLPHLRRVFLNHAAITDASIDRLIKQNIYVDAKTLPHLTPAGRQSLIEVKLANP